MTGGKCDMKDSFYSIARPVAGLISLMSNRSAGLFLFFKRVGLCSTKCLHCCAQLCSLCNYQTLKTASPVIQNPLIDERNSVYADRKFVEQASREGTMSIVAFRLRTHYAKCSISVSLALTNINLTFSGNLLD